MKNNPNGLGHRLSAWFLGWLFLSPAGLVVAGQPGWDELARLDQLPVLRPTAKVASLSSYDRSGGNDDGFSGKYSFVSKEPDGLVIADLKGPGVIHRIWTPTPSEDVMEFFFDGEAQPRIQVGFRDLFLGQHPVFPRPLVGIGAGGFYSYVPLPYAQSCKIRVRGKQVQFYQINYTTYPQGTPVVSYAHPLPPPVAALKEQACRLLAASGSDISAFAAPPGKPIQTTRPKLTLAPKATTRVGQWDQPGRLVGLRLSPASAVAGKARDLILRIAFDGEEPAVLCPLGDFFGFAWGQPAMKSLLVGTVGEVMYAYFPMPFERTATIDILSERSEATELTAEILGVGSPRTPDEGRFYAVWRRENPTTTNAPFTFLETTGTGHIVGCVLQSQGFESGKTLFFEGDDQTTIDGNLVIHGTGSEDFFNGGWYDVPDRWEKRLSFPLSGCLGYAKHLGRTGGYRFMLGDAYVFQREIRHTMEHGGTSNSIPTDYCATTYFYAKQRPTMNFALPSLAERRVIDLHEIVFPAWWQIPINAFCFEKASLSRRLEKIDGQDVRSLGLTAAGSDWFGSPFLSLTCEVPSAGAYEIYLEAIKGPAQGKVQLFQNEVPIAPPVDLYAATRSLSGRVGMGKLALAEGPNNLMFKLVGKHDQAEGLGLDLIQVICVYKP